MTASRLQTDPAEKRGQRLRRRLVAQQDPAEPQDAGLETSRVFVHEAQDPVFFVLQAGGKGKRIFVGAVDQAQGAALQEKQIQPADQSGADGIDEGAGGKVQRQNMDQVKV